MITESIFIAGLFFLLVLLLASFHFKNPAFCSITIVYLLFLCLVVVPGGTGYEVQTGNNITSLVDGNTTTTLETKTYTTQTSWSYFMVFILLVFYLALEINNFVKEKKEQKENYNHED